MIKRFLILTAMTLLFTLTCTVQVTAQPPKQIYFEGFRINSQPVMENGTLLAELRPVTETLGFNVEWNPLTQTVTAHKDDLIVELKIGSENVLVNGVNRKLSPAPEIINDRTLVTFQFIELLCELDDKIIDWNENTGIVTIKRKNKFLTLTEDEILEALEIGKKGPGALERNRFKSRYKLPVEEGKLWRWRPDIWFKTPYYQIVETSCKKSTEFKKYTLEEAKEFIRMLKAKNLLTFEITAYSDYIGIGKKINFILKQEDRLILPQKITGNDELADITSSWPFPTYKLPLMVSFNAGEIDFHKKAVLVYFYRGENTFVSYTLDFSRYK
ncbi:copper amine oxidase N-terminal domain-containing protein [Desulfolucanica intricata]|uniref:copper amine oxidase N-terminal domain-containing protein n=1 Tax=Desulfolucanica intricata TaxID=1285191 RepID=UPI0008358FD3|nr:copper amine oxidase N-terminal domain-containing protein [Desulfolucanica intricata]